MGGQGGYLHCQGHCGSLENLEAAPQRGTPLLAGVVRAHVDTPSFWWLSPLPPSLETRQYRPAFQSCPLREPPSL